MPDIFDGSWKLFAHDADTGRTIWSQWIDGKITFRVDSPVDHIVAANKAALNADHPHRFGDYVHVAAVPLQLYHQAGLAAAIVQHDDRHISRFLSDTDNAAWRTREGRF
jgi:hypothetical protein